MAPQFKSCINWVLCCNDTGSTVYKASGCLDHEISGASLYQRHPKCPIQICLFATKSTFVSDSSNGICCSVDRHRENVSIQLQISCLEDKCITQVIWRALQCSSMALRVEKTSVLHWKFLPPTPSFPNTSLRIALCHAACSCYTRTTVWIPAEKQQREATIYLTSNWF